MAKQLNVNLSFNADTKQAKAEIEALSKALQTIAKMPGKASSLFDDTEIKKASQAALELQQHLSKAVNTDTGKLDLSRFSSSLKASNKDLSTYCNTLLKTGQQGQQAFLQLAKAIASADTPVTRVNKKLAEMGTTLKNTARWQISSSILHGFMGSIQSAYGYAQDLNKSLNDIRIVTGQNIEQMSKFAVEANRAAKALSTTTTDYTNASLIYFQQGLSAEEVAKRTEVTVKMANAAGVSAQTASDQLTAVWNNFYDGTKSLEYYADVMTALGAATASSTDEIAGGLEKFAAIGETIGLSYEYAASALATITSNTRQSEEVVGTALKTIFARIQGLNLGETLDDGTTLNKYSAALEQVGISIFQQNGEIKKMDDILDEMASKWSTLAKDQQIALAQTVAGVRQYTQLVALMDNWNAGDTDSMVANLDTSYNASGALQEQADIYAESWEAAQDRVRAAAENIYDSLINDEFFIDILNGFEHILESVGGLVDGLGGLKGVIGVIGSVFLTNFAQKMPATLENLRQNLMVFTGQAQKEMVKVQDKMSAKMAVQASAPGASESFKTQAEAILQVAKMKQKLILESKNLTSQEKEAYEARIKNVEAMYDEAIALAQVVEEQKKKAQTSAKSVAKNASKDIESLYSNRDQAGDQRDNAERIRTAAEKDGNNVEMERQAQAVKEAEATMDDYNAKISDAIAAYKKLGIEIVTVNEKGEEVFDTSKSKEMAAAVKKVTDEYKQQVTQWKQLEVLQDDMSGQVDHWKQNAEEIDKSEEAVKDLKVAMAGYRDAITTIATQNDVAFDETELQALNAALQDPKTSAVECAAAFEKFKQSIDGNLTSKMDSLNASIEESSDTLEKLGLSTTGLSAMKKSAEDAAEGVTKLTLSTGNIKGQVDQGIDSTFKMSVALTQFGATAMSVSTMLNSINSAINVFKDEGATGLEKFGAAISIVTAAMSAYNSVTALSNTLLKSRAMAEMTATLMTKLGIAAKVSETGAVVANTAAWYANPIMWIALIIVGVVAALAALVAAIGAVSKALADAYNADAIAAEKATKAANELADSYNNVKQEYQDMIATIENYQSARDALSELTKGTEEYRNALQEANRQALELIENYGNYLSPEDYYWQGEELIINQDALSQAKYQKSREESEAYAAAQMANISAKEATNIANTTTLKRQMQDEVGVGFGDRIAAGIMNAITASLGIIAAVPTYRASLAATAFAISDSANRDIVAEQYNEAIDKVLEKYQDDSNILTGSQEEFAKNMESLDITNTDLINALYDNRDALINLGNDFIATSEAQKVAAQNTANEIMADSGYQNSKAGQMALEAGGEIYSQLYEDAKKEYSDLNLKRGKGYQAWEQYAAQQGLTSLNGFKVTKKSKDQIEYEYIDKEGNKQTKIATEEMIVETLAAADAAGELKNSLSELRQTIANLNTSEDISDHALANFLSSGNLEDSTKNEYEELKNRVAKEGIDSVLGLTGNAEADLALAKNRGYESVAAYKAAFEEALNIEWKVPSRLADNIADKLTIGAAEKINKTYEAMGSEGGNAYLGALKQISDSIDWDSLTPEEQSEAWNEIANIDWSNWDAGKNAVQIVKDLGGELDTTSQAWQKNIEAMRDASNALPDFKQMKEELAQVKEISDDIELGSIISEEDYELLCNFNSELSEYFTILSDGSARFTGDLLDFQQAITETSRQNLLEATREYTDRANELQAQLEAGYAILNGESVDNYRDTELYTEDGKEYYSGSNVKTQLDFLSSQGYDSDQISSWSQDLEDGFMNPSTLAEIAAAVDETANSFNNLNDQIATTQGLAQSAMNEIALGAEDANERLALLESEDINAEAYGYAAMAAHNEEKWEGLDPDEVESYADHLMEAAEASNLLSDELKNNEEAAEDVAAYTKKMNRGIKDLAEGFKDWSDILKKSNAGSEEFAEAMSGMKSAMSDILGVQKDFLSDDFILQNMEDIKKAANGDAEAIDRLAIAAGKDILIHLELENEGIREELYDLHDELAAEIPNIEVGATLNDGDFLSKAAQIVEAANMTVEQANAYFRSLGFEPHFETTQVPVTRTLKGTRTYTSDVKLGTIQTSNGPYHYIEEALQRSEEVDMGPVTEWVEVPALTTDGGKPNFTLTRTNAGSMNNYSKSNSGGAGPKGSSSKGGGSKKQTKEIKTAKDEIDRYHTVKEQLEELSKQLDKVAKAKDRAFGKAKLDLINQEIELLDKEIEKQELYLSQIESNARTDKALMVVYGAEFDENGVITNYEALMQQELEKYNSAVIAYNNDNNETTFAAAEARYEKFKEDLAQYEETMDLWFDEEEKRAELLREQYDKQLEALTYKVELEISLEDDELKMIEYYLELIEDDSFAAAEAIALLGEKTQNTLDKIKIYSEGISELLDLHGMDQDDLDQIMAGNITNEELAEKGFTENDISTLRSYIDELMNANLELKELKDTMQEKVLDAFDAFMEKLDKSAEKIEYLNNVIENYKNIIDLVGAKTLGLNDEFMKNLSQAAVSTATDLVESNRIKYKSALEAQKKAQAEYEAAVARGDEESIKMWEETLQEIDSEVQESHENMLSSWESALQMAADAFDQAVERTIANFEKAISGTYGSLESLMTAFERHSEINERYVEDYKKIYELSRLNRDITNSIDETDSIKAKQALKKLQEEINKLQENDTQMSQYDLDYLQKKYDLKLAEIALEDAQNAKTQVRLRRDTEGNFSYVYTGDQTTIDNAQQNYEDKLYEMQEFNDEYLKTVQENILNSEIELADALAELDRNKFATDEEYYAEVNRITEYYVEQHKFWIDEANKALKNNKNTYEEDWNNYSKITGYKISKNEDYVDSFDETIYAQLTGYESLEEAQFSFVEATNIMIEELDAAFEEWLSNYDAIMLAAGTSSENFANDTTQALETIKEESSEAVEQASEDADDISDAFGEICDAVSAWQEEYSDAISSAMDSNENMIDSCTSLISQLSNVNGSLADTGRNFINTASEIAAAAESIEASAARAAAAAASVSTSGSKVSPGGSPSSPGSQQNKSVTITLYSTRYLQGKMGTMKVTANTPISVSNQLQEGGASYYASGSGWQGYISTDDRLKLRQTFPERFDTGGYTGAWGSSGKLAILHEKELVLNKQDTENLLTSVEILRNIMNTLDLQTNYNQLSGILTAPVFNSPSNDILEQIVQIQAEFPNVTNRSEIEEAFDTLINRASQYANRKK